MNKIKSNPYKTILTICFGFFIAFLVWKTNWALLAGLIISFLALINLGVAKLIEKIWFKIADILGFFIPNIVLTVVFYFVLFPFSLLFKLFSKSKGTINALKGESSTFINVSKKFQKKDFINPW